MRAWSSQPQLVRFLRSTDTHCRFCGRTYKATNRAAGCNLALPGDSLEVLHDKNVHLRAKLEKLPWPRLTSFVADKRLYPLPLSTYGGPPTFDRAEAMVLGLQYLTGFFDGDGCVTSFGTSGTNRREGYRTCSMQVTQSYDSADVLMMYHRAFGGGIYRLGDGKGLRKPALQWQLRDRHSVHFAANLLAQNSVTKKNQLQIAACWPWGMGAREASAAELRSLKEFDSSRRIRITWEYFTGFFDAEGCISMNGKSGLRLSLAQKHITVLECLQDVLARDMGIAPTIRKRAHINEMQIYTTSICQRILERMLSSGLVRKKRQAELALDLRPDNSDEIREALSALSGNQRFGKSLDQAGVDRARDISIVRRRAALAEDRGQPHEATRIRQEVDALKLEHATKNAQRENFRLHAYVQEILDMQHEDVFCTPDDTFTFGGEWRHPKSMC